MKKVHRYSLVAVFIGALLGATAGASLIVSQVADPVFVNVSGLPKCGPEEHPATGNLVIVTCIE